MTSLILSLETELSLDMSILRDGAFRKAVPEEPIYDRFDDGSLHILARIDGIAASMVRISPWPVCPMGTWLADAQSSNPFPTGPNTLELTGTVVAPAFRNRGLYRLLMLATLLYSQDHGYHGISAAVEPDFPALPFLQELGFQTGEALVFKGDMDARLTAIPLWLTASAPLQARWQEMYATQCRACEHKDIQVEPLPWLTA